MTTEASQSTQVVQSVMETQFKTILDNIASLTKFAKTLQDDVKTLQKLCKTLDKKSKSRKKRPQDPMALSKTLCEFLGVAEDTHMTKADVMKQISAFIKENNLQIAEDKRRFIPNKKLSALFNVKVTKETKMTFVEINKYITQHLTKLE